MDLPKRVAPQGSPGRYPKEMAHRAMEADENATPRRPVTARSASPQRKRVLGERNGVRSLGDGASAQPKVPAPTPPSPTEARAGAYDPKTNCTTPRPDFLRYDPKRSAEILLRLEREAEAEAEESSGLTSGTEISEAVCSGSLARECDSECDDDADEEEEEVVLPPQGGRWARRLFLLLVSAACLFCYINCLSSTPFPATSEEPLNFVGLNGSTYDHEVFSLMGPIDMMGLEDEPGADIGQIVYRDSEDGVLLHRPGGSPSNFMAVAMMGMADSCPNVPFGEFSCQIGDESSEIVDVLKEDSEIGKLESEEKAEESSEVVCSGGDVIGDSFGSTLSYDMEEDQLGLVHQEKREDDSEHSMVESESVMVENEDKGLGSEKLDKEFDSWEYENTAGAAKELVHIVKFFWSAVEPHLLKMLACLSVAGFVTAMLKYSQRSRNVNVPVSQRISSAPPARVPILAPHNVAPLPVFHSEQQAMPKQELSSCLELPVQSLLPKPDPSFSLNVPSVGHMSHHQKIQQGDAGIVRGSDVMDHNDIEKSKPPVVQLLGEFSFVDTGSSRGRSVKDSNRHGGDTMVQELVSLKKDVTKMQKESDKIQSPGTQAAMKKENAAEEERMDATPTPLRRSTRLRKKVSP